MAFREMYLSVHVKVIVSFQYKDKKLFVFYVHHAIEPNS